ncbi:MAG: tripartite tricarboxylate transporter substrate binding protein [Limnohabitans sp.]|jgi:tripartite-type tricarboxylate transporter receptor subunit TctC|nr:tripartite tricarboxylate transporter substrate binding protein [Limnohabitans sp.]
MKLSIRSFLLAAIGGLFALTLQAQSYPSKPVRVVVPYPPGGPTDIVARVLFQQVAESTGQQFLIDNRAGAGGNIGAEAVAKAPADGYTLLIGTTAHAINMSLFKSLNYDVQKDLAPVSLLTQGPLVLVTHPQFPANSIKELIDMAKAKPGSLNFASSGNGQSTHLSAELFNSMAGIKMVHVPYKGSAPALGDLMSGQVGIMFDTTLSAMPFVKAGKLKALGVTSPQRTPAAPDVPTIAESGLPGYEVFAWNGVLVPAGTPKAIVAQLNEEIRKAMQLPQVREKFSAQGFAASWNTPDQFGVFVRNEVEKWARTVKASGATLD